MRPNTEIGNFLGEEATLMEEHRLGTIAVQLDAADKYFDTLTTVQAVPLVAYRIASGLYSFEDAYYRDIFRGGSVSEAHITPVYDGYFSEEQPGIVIGSRCLRIQIQSKKSMPFSRKPLPPAATFYMFAQQADTAEHHTPKSEPDTQDTTMPIEQDPDGPPLTSTIEPALDQSRFPMPQVGAYQFGIVRRSGTVVCFSIEENEGLNTVSVPEVEGANEHILDMMPNVATIDRNPEKMTPLDMTGKLCGDVLRDLGAIAALTPPEKPRRSWKSLFLKKTVTHPDNKDKPTPPIAGIPDLGSSKPTSKDKDPKDVKE